MDKQTHPGDCQILNNPKSVRHNYFYDYVKNNAEQIVIIEYPDSQQIPIRFLHNHYYATNLLNGVPVNRLLDGLSSVAVAYFSLLIIYPIALLRPLCYLITLLLGCRDSAEIYP